MSESRNRNRSHWPLVALSLIPAVLGVLLPLVLVRMVTPAEVGTFKVFFLYLGVAPALLLTSGLKSGLAYWAGQESKRIPAMEVSASLLLLVGLIGTALALAFNSHISSRLSAPPREAYLFALSLLGAIAGCYFEEAAIALGRVWRGALFYCGWEVIRTVVIVLALFHYHSVSAVLVAHTAVSTMKLLAGYWHGYQLGIVGFSLDLTTLKEVWRYALPVSFAYVFGIFIASADQFLLASRISPSEFALYSIGCLSIAPLFSFEQSVTRVLIPQMSEAFAKQQTHRAAALYQSAVDNLGFILFPAVTGLIIYATPIIELFFTKRYSSAANYLQLFGLSYLLLIIPYDALARSRGNVAWILRTFIIFAAASLVCSYVLIPFAGPVGALTGVLISGVTLRLYAIQHFRSELSLRLADFLPFKSCFHYSLLCVILGAAVLFSRSHFSTHREWLFGSGCPFAAAYLCLALPIKNRAERHRHGGRGVLLLTQSLQVGGLERMVLHLGRHLRAENQWQIRVLAYDHCNQKQSLVDEFRRADIPVEVFKKKPGFSLRVIGRLLQTVYSNDITIIHSHDLGTLIYAVFAKIYSFGRVSVVHTQHSFPSQEKCLRYRIYRRIFSHGIDQLGVVSEDVLTAYSKIGFKRNHIHLIENGVDFATEAVVDRSEKVSLRHELLQALPAETQHRIEPYLNDLWILYQARFYPGKGQEHSLRLWTELRDEDRRGAILCFIGPESAEGEYGRIQALIKECPDQERILMIGTSTTPLQWLKAGDVFLSCSEYEGMPLAPLEAAGSGLPLLLSRIPGHAFLKDVGFQFPLDDIQQGAEQMHSLLQQVYSGGEHYQQELWRNSRHIREQFSIARMSQQYSDLYSMCLSA